MTISGYLYTSCVFLSQRQYSNASPEHIADRNFFRKYYKQWSKLSNTSGSIA